MYSKIDLVCKNIVQSNFFCNGWGNPDNLRRIFEFRKIVSKRDSCMGLVSTNHPIEILKKSEHGDHYILKGRFSSPAVNYLTDLLPEESRTAHFEMIVPKQLGRLKPICLHLAGTGDHGFWRRRILTAKPLLQETGISSIILENPFYGCRKPKEQIRSNLCNVSDLFIMGMCLVLESIALFHWAEKQGFGPLGITGISMGGHMASLAASIWPKPLAITPCLSWTTASHVFTEGVMTNGINWKVLKNQYFSNEVYREELFNMVESPEGYFRVLHKLGHLSEVDEIQKNFDNNSNVSFLKREESTKSFRNPLKIMKSIPIRKQRAKNFCFDESTAVLPKPPNSKQKSHVKFEPYLSVRDAITWEALQFMRGIMDDCTHLGNYPVPVDPSLAIIVSANKDAYVPSRGTIPLTEIWPGSKIRKLNSGHISAFLFQQQFFRNAIRDSFNLIQKKYYHDYE